MEMRYIKIDGKNYFSWQCCRNSSQISGSLSQLKVNEREGKGYQQMLPRTWKPDFKLTIIFFLPIPGT